MSMSYVLISHIIIFSSNVFLLNWLQIWHVWNHFVINVLGMCENYYNFYIIHKYFKVLMWDKLTQDHMKFLEYITKKKQRIKIKTEQNHRAWCKKTCCTTGKWSMPTNHESDMRKKVSSNPKNNQTNHKL